MRQRPGRVVSLELLESLQWFAAVLSYFLPVRDAAGRSEALL